LTIHRSKRMTILSYFDRRETIDRLIQAAPTKMAPAMRKPCGSLTAKGELIGSKKINSENPKIETKIKYLCRLIDFKNVWMEEGKRMSCIVFRRQEVLKKVFGDPRMSWAHSVLDENFLKLNFTLFEMFTKKSK